MIFTKEEALQVARIYVADVYELKEIKQAKVTISNEEEGWHFVRIFAINIQGQWEVFNLRITHDVDRLIIDEMEFPRDDDEE